jgi:D-glycero-D-manno-heptose 1,7-bisphosphate phosphatase
MVNSKGFYAFLVTNQAGIAKGLYSEADYVELHRHMRAELSQSGARFDDERYCPFHPDGVDPAYRKVSDWRKPEPGMFLDLMRFWPVDKTRSVMIGDRDSDMRAAAAAGIAGRLFTGEERLDEFVSRVLNNLSPEQASESLE